MNKRKLPFKEHRRRCETTLEFLSTLPNNQVVKKQDLIALYESTPTHNLFLMDCGILQGSKQFSRLNKEVLRSNMMDTDLYTDRFIKFQSEYNKKWAIKNRVSKKANAIKPIESYDEDALVAELKRRGNYEIFRLTRTQL